MPTCWQHVQSLVISLHYRPVTKIGIRALLILMLILLVTLLPACAPRTPVKSPVTVESNAEIPDTLEQIRRIEAEDTPIKTGFAQAGDGFIIIDDPGASRGKALHYPIDAPRLDSDVILWGPYEELEAGSYVAIWRIRISDNGFIVPVAALEVTSEDKSNAKSEQAAKAELTGKEFPEAGRFFIFSLPFQLKQTSRVELRLRWYGQTDIDVDYRAIAIPR